MYNPYNWKIKTNEKKSSDMCILDELTVVFNDIALCETELSQMQKKFGEKERKLVELNERKRVLLDKLSS